MRPQGELGKRLLDSQKDVEAPSLDGHGEWHGSHKDSIVISIPSEHSVLVWESRRSSSQVFEDDPLSNAYLLQDEHLISLDELAARYNTDIDATRPEQSKGLDAVRAEACVAIIGANSLSPQPSQPAWVLFLKEMNNPLNVMLITAGVLSLLIYPLDTSDGYTPLELGCVLLVVTLINALIDFIEHQKADKVLKSFGGLVASTQVVIRDGVHIIMDPEKLTLGDIVVLKAGDKIPADVRFIVTNTMKVDNSSLTGESDPLHRLTTCKGEMHMEAENIGFFGTTVVSGNGLGVVIRTGDRTTMGQIAASAGRGPKKESPLTTEILQFVKTTAVLATVTGTVFFIAGMIIKPSFIDNFVFFIGIFVAFVPQGLPATVTMLLTFAATRLKNINVLVKDLHAVDTLGTITLLASDKTGTMTMNRMTVVDLWLNKATHSTERAGRPLQLESVQDSYRLVQCCLLCSNARFTPLRDGQCEQEVIGDATEAGLLRFAALYHPDTLAFRQQYPQALDVPFDSAKKWAMSINAVPHADGQFTLFIKGAPERVLKKCTTALVAGREVAVDAEFSLAFNAAYERMAGQGERVIACAELRLPASQYPASFSFTSENYPDTGYTFVGLVGLRDPPKPGVAQAVAQCKSAGIQVVMVTGDHPLTAEAIARQVGIIGGETRSRFASRLGISEEEVLPTDYQAVVIHGDQIDDLTNEDWEEILHRPEIVFARTSPQHKLEIVVRFQAMGHVVGVTGDGINDSPALKRADMGISMALTGSDVSKEAASIILMDDNFASVVEGIKEGRQIFNNIKKAIMYTLTHTMPEVIPFLLYISLGLPVAINSFLILCIDLCTEIAPALSFAWEAPEDNIMHVSPRRFVKPMSPAVVATRGERPELEKIKGFEIQEVDIHKPEFQSVAHRLGYYWFRIMQWKLQDKNPEDETLVDEFVFKWSYLQAGLIEAGVALAAYLWVFSLKGVCPGDLYDSASDYFSWDSADDFVTCTGTILDVDMQMERLYSAQAAYFVTVVCMQCVVAYLVKVRRGFPCGRKYFRNLRTYAAMAFSLSMAAIIVLTPGLSDLLEAATFPLIALFAPIGGGVLLVTYESMRRRLQPDAGLYNRARTKLMRQLSGGRSFTDLEGAGRVDSKRKSSRSSLVVQAGGEKQAAAKKGYDI